MNSSKQSDFSARGQRKRVPPAVVGLIGLVFMFVTNGEALAQLRIESTSDLKTACETSPGNVVTLDQSTKIFLGSRPPAVELVNSGCTLVLGSGANLEVERVSMRFAGPFAVQSATKGEVKFIKSLFTARSMVFSLVGGGSALATTESTLQAFAGSLSVNLGDDGKVELINRLLPGPSDAVSATSTIQISGGRKFSGLITEMNLRAPQGVRVTMDGEDGSLKVDQVFFYAEQGSVAILASGPKNQVEMSSANLRFGNAAVIRFAGIDSGIKLKQVFAGSADGRVDPGAVYFEAGMGSADNGKVEVSEFSTGDVGLVTMTASRNGQKGSLKLEKSTVSSNGDTVLETGPSGTTQVKENSVFSGTRIRVASGLGGSCVAQPNVLSAPVVEACP